jgi:hypothetical protein
MKEKLVQQTMFGTPAEDEQAIILADLRGHLSDLRQRLNNAKWEVEYCTEEIDQTERELAKAERGESID